jgi:type I restriction enzyme S subunit
MKKDWQTRNLGELCRIRTGKKDVNEGNPEGEFPFFTCAAEHTFSDSYSFDTEALLIAGNGDVGNVSYYNGKFEAYQRTYVLSDFADVSPRFLYLILDGKLKDTVSKQKLGNTMPYIKVGMLTDFQLPVPPLPEQQRIVGLLDEAFACLATAKANAEKNLQNARALFEGHLQSVFTQRGPGWVEKPFEDCIEDVKYTTKIQRKEFLEEGEFPIVSQEADFTNGYWNNAADVFKVTRPIVIFGDHTQVLKYIDFDFVLGADGVKILPPKPFLNPKFFFYSLRSAPVKALGYARHYRLLKELQISYPDMDKQFEIVTKLDSLSEETQRLASLYERKLELLEALKKSLLNEAFTGKL